jgi:diguanylate cyclase (GGDEF)-like protein/PAS domain S-box-containing protein
MLGHKPGKYNFSNKWHTLLHPDDLGRVTAKFQACTAGTSAVFECEYRLKAKDGSWRWVWSRGAVVERDTRGHPSRMTGTLIDITKKKAVEEQTWRHANICPLTELPNRRHFRDRLEVELRRSNRTHHSLVLLFIDLDGFKQVNDLFGHDAGDKVLIETASRLRHSVRASDIVARLGGDEFTIILTELPGQDDHVEQICQKVIACLCEPIKLGEDIAYISGSVGVALYPLDADTSEGLLRKADQAMYAAKAGGKNQFHYFTQELDERAHARLLITTELRHALERNQLTVYYQPVVSVPNNRIIKVEALLRWRHPLLGEVSPSDFIPLAEECGAILSINRWVLNTACEQNVAWQRIGLPPLCMSVNLSARSFVSEALIDDIRYALLQSGMSPLFLELELTESTVAPHPERAQAILYAIKQMGVRLAIDDFGTGYSSLTQLKDYPVDTLKVDQSFIRNIAHSSKDQSVTLGIIAMAKSMGLTVVVEGVETDEQRAFVDASDCDESQGYLFCRPVPSSAIESLLRAQHPI